MDEPHHATPDLEARHSRIGSIEHPVPFRPISDKSWRTTRNRPQALACRRDRTGGARSRGTLDRQVREALRARALRSPGEKRLVIEVSSERKLGATLNLEPGERVIDQSRKSLAVLLPLARTAPDSPYDRNILRLAFLAPDIQRDIMAGLQPRGLNLERLRKTSLPLAWPEQRKALGWPESA